MTARQLADWQVAYRFAPWGEDRADMRMARLAWATLMPHLRKKTPREDRFLFRFRPEYKRPLTPDEYMRKSMRAMIAHGGGPSIAAAVAAGKVPGFTLTPDGNPVETAAG